MPERVYLLALTMINGLGILRIQNLLNYFGSASSIWQASEKELKQVNGINKLAEKIVKQRKKINIENILENLAKNNIKYVTIFDNNYPDKLRDISKPPPVIYYKGKYDNNERIIAIVGSRRATRYGCNIARNLAYSLAGRGFAIISGFARGIDTCAHKGALKVGGRTIAVLGTGLNRIYPPENKKLTGLVTDSGYLLSELTPETGPLASNFPRRNRIISGLAEGVIVVEASNRSGSLITANYARKQGKFIFSVPGNINRPQSQGTNNLIKKGARVLTSVDDVLNTLPTAEKPLIKSYNRKNTGDKSTVTEDYSSLSPEEKKVVSILQGEDLHINQIITLTGFDASQVNKILLNLELKGLISPKQGKKYTFLGLQNLLKPI
ncbi:DNA-processing protein DprA [Halothermothrix orenii]|nr:DNA-processing protein DprA [Halothermothrix orenii]